MIIHISIDHYSWKIRVYNIKETYYYQGHGQAICVNPLVFHGFLWYTVGKLILLGYFIGHGSPANDNFSWLCLCTHVYPRITCDIMHILPTDVLYTSVIQQGPMELRWSSLLFSVSLGERGFTNRVSLLKIDATAMKYIPTPVPHLYILIAHRRL